MRAGNPVPHPVPVRVSYHRMRSKSVLPNRALVYLAGRSSLRTILRHSWVLSALVYSRTPSGCHTVSSLPVPVWLWTAP